MATTLLALLGTFVSSRTGHASILELDPACSNRGDCSNLIQNFFDACMGERCELYLRAGATYRMRHEGWLNATGVSGLVLDGRGARIITEGAAGVFFLENCSDVSMRNVTISVARLPYTLCKVTGGDTERGPSTVQCQVDMQQYPFPSDGPSWLRQVGSLIELDAAFRHPKRCGLNWIYNASVPPLNLTANPDEGVIEFSDPGFGLATGARVVLRHTVWGRHSFLLSGCRRISMSDVVLRAGPGMGFLAYDTTDIALTRLINAPEPGFPLGTNADAIHLASCRGEVQVEGCVADGQGDDGINVHSQYAVVLNASRTGDQAVLHVGPNSNADDSTWVRYYARPAIRVGDPVRVRAQEDLSVSATGTVSRVDGSWAGAAVRVAVSGLTRVPRPGDMLEPLASNPSRVVVRGSVFANNRASGAIIMCSDILIENNTFANSTGAGLSVGPYWDSFGEASFTSNLVFRGNWVDRTGQGGRARLQVDPSDRRFCYGQDTTVRIARPYREASSTLLYRNLTVAGNAIRGLSPLQFDAALVDTLAIEDNKFWAAAARWKPTDRPIRVQNCTSVTESGNQCCASGQCAPCPKTSTARVF